MAFHVPFNQRNRNRQGPVYIGFNDPPRFRHKFNWWGFNGLWMSLAAFFSLGFLSIISLFVSMRGLGQKPRKMAIAGTLFSLIGVAIAGSIAFTHVSHQMKRHHARQVAQEKRVMAVQIEKCKPIMTKAIDELQDYREANDGYLPTAINGNMLVIKHVDPWGQSLRFEPEKGDFATVRSAGPDKNFDSRDDITSKIDGKTTDTEILLPLDE